MKKIIALFTAVVFALTLGVAFAQEQAAAPAEKKAEDTAAPKKAKKTKKKVKKTKKTKKAKMAEEKKMDAPAAAPAAK